MTALDNPFAPGRLRRVLGFDPALAGTTWEALEARWRELGWRAAVTGHHGSGKTSLLVLPELPSRWEKCDGNLRELLLGCYDDLAAGKKTFDKI